MNIIFRKDIIDQKVKERELLFKVTKTKDNNYFINDPKVNGRSAYFTPSIKNIQKIKEKNLLSRALRTKVPNDIFDRIFMENKKENDIYSLINIGLLSKKILLGQDNIIHSGKKIILLLIAEDASKNTTRKIFNKVEPIEVTSEIRKSTFKRTFQKEISAVAFLDKGFADKYKELIKQGVSNGKI